MYYRSTPQGRSILRHNPHRRHFTVTLDQARQRAERNFQKEERQLDARKAMTEYDAQARATREKTARLKALRLAKEASNWRFECLL
jgi:Skp family chaperone for outer membrane proteins